MRHAVVISIFAVGAALAVAACGGRGISPNAPSSSGAAAGARISGALVAPAGAAALNAGPSGLNVVVSVAGSSIKSNVDDHNQFQLSDVPPGDVSLQFSGKGVNGKIDLPAVQSTDAMNISVTVDNGGVSLTSSDAPTDPTKPEEPQIQIEGRVDALPPTIAAGSLSVDGQIITTDAQTVFTLDGGTATYASLVVGQRVHVKALQSGTTLRATIVDIQNVNVDIPVQVHGIVSSFSGTASSFQFMIDTTQVKGDNTTTFDGKNAFASLKNGVRVEVHGTQKNGFVFATSMHIN